MNRLVLVFCGLLLATACSTPERPDSKVPTPAATQIESSEYAVLNVKDISVSGRKRMEVSIMAPTAKTFESRGQVVVAACKAVQREQRVDVIRVWLEPNDNTRGLGFVLAMATYSPDGKGMTGQETSLVWDNVSATGYQVAPEALKMTKDSNLGDIGMEQARIIGSRRPYQPH